MEKKRSRNSRVLVFRLVSSGCSFPTEFKGGTLTEAEREARRAETARRRKNQSEKKLEDDKVSSVSLSLASFATSPFLSWRREP